MNGDRQAIHPNLRLAVFRIAISQGGEDEYEAVKKEYLNTTSVDGKEIGLQALGRVPTSELAKNFLEFQFSPSVAVQDIHSGSNSLAHNTKARNTLWHYIQHQWPTVHGKISANPVVLARFLRLSLSQFANHDIEREISTFFADKDTKAYDKTLAQVSDTVRGNANYKERDEALLLEWLKAHDYV